MEKRIKPLIIGLCIFLVCLIFINLIKQAIMGYFLSRYKPPPVTVSSVVAKTRTWQPYLSAVGSFVAINGVEVDSQASGNVVKLHFESGQTVQMGDPLVDLDDRVEQAVLKFNEADLALKGLNYQRMQTLIKQNATSGVSLDEAKANLDQATANVDKIKAQLALKHIVAPFSGKLGIRKVDMGQYVTAGQTHIVPLQSLDSLFINFYLPEQNYPHLSFNQSVLVQIEGYPHLRFVSKITAINPKADPNTHNIEVQATLHNCPIEALQHPESSKALQVEPSPLSPNLSLITCHAATDPNTHYAFLPGMFAALSISLPSVSDVIVLPSTAISYSLYGNAVYLIQGDATQGYHVKRQFVTTGDQNANEIVILSGLKPNDLVVSTGELKLQNETPIVIDNRIKLNDKADFNQLGQ